jgi:8-oxo-dGTP pyrophosphatase MutT (NUDIX family)
MEVKQKFRKIVFIVTYAKLKDKTYYLVLKRKLHWKGWEFPKGGVDFPELKKSAVKREILEETGNKALKIKKFNFSGKYKYKKKFGDRKDFIGQSFHLYSVEIKYGKAKLDKTEHSEYKWLLFEEAVKKVTFPNQKKSLKIVNDWLKNEK